MKSKMGGSLGYRLSVTVESNAIAAASREFRYGAERGVDRLVFVTLGTGVGTEVITHETS